MQYRKYEKYKMSSKYSFIGTSLKKIQEFLITRN